MTWQPGDSGNGGGEISRADLLPFLTSFSDLRQRGFFWPGVTVAIFTAALLVLAALGNETGFFWALAGLISLTNLYLAYLWCGKKLPFWYVAAVTVIAFFMDVALSPVIVAVEKFVPAALAPGLAEETVKVLPLIAVLLIGGALPHRLQRRYALREPLDGILLAAASATAFAFLETMFVYVPQFGALISTPRLLVNVFSHIAYAGILGYFIGLAALRHRRRLPAALAVLIGFAIANLLHDLYDSMRYYGDNLAFISPIHETLLAIVSLIVFGSVILKARDVSPEREFLWPYGSLPPYSAPEVEPLPPMPALPGDYWLALGGRRLSLTERAHLTVRDIPCLSAPGADGVVAEVREHPDDPSLLVLRNLSTNIWEAVLPDGTVRHIEPAGTVRIVAGTRLVFGTQSGAILVTSTDIGADPRAKADDEWC